MEMHFCLVLLIFHWSKLALTDDPVLHTILPHAPRDTKLRVTCQPAKHVFGLWKKAGAGI